MTVPPVVAVDTSAIIAVLANEPEAAHVASVLEDADRRLLSAGTHVELGIVLAGKGAGVTVADVIRDLELTVVPVDDAGAASAVAAWHHYGRGRHPASLNYGDCFSYALASGLNIPLVAIGNDFLQTDLSVLP